MLDSELIALLVSIINTGLTAQGITGITVVQKDQPTQQGVPQSPTVFLTKMTDHRYGFLNSKTSWQPLDSKEILTEKQWYESTFQVDALYVQDPAVASLTASDLVNIVAGIMQSAATRQTLKNNNVGILRIQDVRNPAFTDDKQRFEYIPSFDFTVTHERITLTEINPVTEIIPGIYRI